MPCGQPQVAAAVAVGEGSRVRTPTAKTGPNVDIIYSPAVMVSIANDLLNTRTDLQTQRMLIQQAYELMYRYASSEQVSSSPKTVLESRKSNYDRALNCKKN